MSSPKNPYWYKLIKLFKTTESRYRITTGLTIPFIYGAYELLEQPFDDIDDLLRAVLDSKADRFPVIQRCPEIKKHILMVEDKSVCTRPSYNFNTEHSLENSSGENFLFIDRNSWNLGKTIEKVSSNLNAEYADAIRNKRFSWNNKNKEWRKFEDGEIALIKSLILKK